MDKLDSIQAGLVMPWTPARGIYNYITENGGKECAADDFAIAGLRTVDYITLAALCVFFFLKWTEPCLLLWDALLLFRKVMGKLFVVDKWAAAWETLQPSSLSTGLGSRNLHSNPGSATCYSLCDLWGNGGVCFSHLYSNAHLRCGCALLCKCFALPRRLSILFITETVFFFVQTCLSLLVLYFLGTWLFRLFCLMFCRLSLSLCSNTWRTGKFTWKSKVREAGQKGQLEMHHVHRVGWQT